ncbi:MAG: DsbA family protein [Anaerosomatales bacterium]|nr:DsbA family protein [Anaerosomatales bacterium]
MSGEQTERTPHESHPAQPEEPVRPRVLVFFDYACPFCYIDQPRFDRLREEYDAEFALVPFELRPRIPREGISAAEHGLGHSERVERRMLELAEEAGLPMELRDHVPNTHRAMLMAELSRDLGWAQHWRTHMAIFRAYYGDGRDIGDDAVLLDVAEKSGLDPREVQASWDEGRYEERLHEFGHVALHLGVTATPSALICNELHIGSRPYGVLREAVQRCLITEQDLEGEE